MAKKLKKDKLEFPEEGFFQSFDFTHTLSTGSTLLDLAISGGRKRGGGIPPGILVEIFGEPGSGKTAILAEICASAQAKGGDILFLDPEARLDAEYARIYGVRITESNYYQPDTVEEVFELIRNWEPKPEEVGAPCVIACDSLAALSTEMELEEGGDKFGARRAKMFSQGLRVVCRLLKQRGWLMVASNQLREKMDGMGRKEPPGGQAIRFYSSLRIRIKQTDKLKKKIKLGESSVEKFIGIRSEAEIVKNSIDDPYRRAFFYVLFGYGVDDLRGNLQWLKDMRRTQRYELDGKKFISMDQAIHYAEENNLENRIRDEVIDLWEELERKVKEDIRKRRKRRER